MKAVVFEQFRQPPSVQNVPDPTPSPEGVVVKVEATGLCRSDWHGWMGHDSDIVLPHVPGHELAGTVEAVGARSRAGASATGSPCPSSAGCGHCAECHSGNHQVCEQQFQPGFTAWGSFAEYVAHRFRRHEPRGAARRPRFRHGRKPRLPLRDVVPRRRRPGPRQTRRMGRRFTAAAAWASPPVMIASAMGANVVAIDLTDEKLGLARDDSARSRPINAAETAERDRRGAGDHQGRRAYVDRRARTPDHLLQLDRQPAPPRPPRAGRPHARRP